MKKTIDSEQINNRLKELMLRDPLVLEYLEKSKQHMESNSELKEGSRVLDLPEDLRGLRAKVFKKWNSRLLEGLASTDSDFSVQKIIPPISELARGKQEMSFPNFPEQPQQASVFFENPGHLYIDIDCSVLDKKDAKYVKNAIWELVTSHLESRLPTSAKGRETGKRKPASPSGDPPELAAIYHMREDVFRKYLKWYDIHKKERLTFRLMAVVENIRKENASEAERCLNTFIHKKVRWGSPVKGEDRIEKAVQQIYSAIHRTPYTQQAIEPAIDRYNCPEHGNECPTSCTYYKEWLGRFNRLNPTS